MAPLPPEAWHLLRQGVRVLRPDLMPFVDLLARGVTMGQQLSSPAPAAAAAEAAEPAALTVSERQFWQALAQRDWGLYAIVGRPNTGKSVLSLALASFINEHHAAPAAVIGIEQWKLAALHFPAREWDGQDESTLLREIGSIETTPGPKILIIDDASLWFGIDSYSRPSAAALRNLINVRRHHQLTLILNCQESAGLHKHLMKPDVLFLKPMSLLYQDVERATIRRVQGEAMRFFSQVSPLEWKRWAYVVSDDPPFRGAVRYGRPPGWKDEFSTSTRPRSVR